MKFVFFGSKALVRASRGVGKALLLLSVPALVWPLVWPPLWLALALTGLTLIIVSWNSVVPDAACGLCLRKRADVLSLVAGEHIGVCDDCAVTATALATVDQHERAASKVLWAMSVLRTMPARAPNSVTTGVIEHAATLEGVDLQALLLEADRVSNHRVKVSLYERVPEAARTATGWINLGVSLTHSGRHEEALAATRRATDENSVPWLLNNVAAIKLRAGVLDAELEPLLADVQQGIALLVERKPFNWELSRAVFVSNIAELEQRLGRHALALEHLDEAAKLAPETTRALLTRHAALTALGRHDDAKAVGVRAKAQVHPDELEANEVNALR